jgi:Ankyrin repeats (3 copies)
MVTNKQANSPFQSVNREYNLIHSHVTSSNVGTRKRKLQEETPIQMNLLVAHENCSLVRHPVDATFEKLDDNTVNEFHMLEGTNGDSDDECLVSYLEPINSPSHVAKRSKVHRVASMSRLSQHVSADQLLPSSTMSASSIAQLMRRMSSSKSAPSLTSMVEINTDLPQTGRSDSTNPDTYLHTILKGMGVDVQTRPSLEVNDFFIQPTDAHVAAYGSDVVMAVRQEDLDTLRKIHLSGRTLQCCNSFGEGIVHMSCRHGSLKLVRFLVEEAGASLQVRDDCGRTPLHDAFWTLKPEIELVKLIISICPDLLLLKDKRGFTPLAYARRNHWGAWCEFLDQNRDLLTPIYNVSGFQQQQ